MQHEVYTPNSEFLYAVNLWLHSCVKFKLSCTVLIYEHPNSSMNIYVIPLHFLILVAPYLAFKRVVKVTLLTTYSYTHKYFTNKLLSK